MNSRKEFRKPIHSGFTCKGFTLIELMIVVAIIGLLSVIAVPGYLGMQQQSKKRSIMISHSGSRSELLHWMRAIQNREEGFVDFDGDGMLTAADDAVLAGMAIADIPAQWDLAHGPAGCNELSPFFPGRLLFQSGVAAGSGQISITCNNTICNILTFTDRVADDAIMSSMVAVD